MQFSFGRFARITQLRASFGIQSDNAMSLGWFESWMCKILKRLSDASHTANDLPQWRGYGCALYTQFTVLCDLNSRPFLLSAANCYSRLRLSFGVQSTLAAFPLIQSFTPYKFFLETFLAVFIFTQNSN